MIGKALDQSSEAFKFIAKKMQSDGDLKLIAATQWDATPEFGADSFSATIVKEKNKAVFMYVVHDTRFPTLDEINEMAVKMLPKDHCLLIRFPLNKRWSENHAFRAMIAKYNSHHHGDRSDNV